MTKRPVGASGLEVEPLMLGGNVFGWTIDEPTSFRILDAFVDAGFNFIDTADVYSRWAPGNQGGESEAIIGRWLKQSQHRDKVIIATKVGMDMGETGAGLGRAHITLAVEESLRRLGVDCIDLYQTHKDDPATPMAETLAVYGDLIRQGKVRAIGASNLTAERLTEALHLSQSEGLPAYTCLQPHYNLAERALFEGPLEDFCVAHDLGVIPYYSLAAGFLTGKYRSAADLGQSQRGKNVEKYLNPRGFALLDALDEVAAQHRANPAQVALAWLIARPSITAPIASATSLKQLDDLIAAAHLTLTPSDIARLDQASAPEANA